jgi:hypothetical protein
MMASEQSSLTEHEQQVFALKCTALKNDSLYETAVYRERPISDSLYETATYRDTEIGRCALVEYAVRYPDIDETSEIVKLQQKLENNDSPLVRILDTLNNVELRILQISLEKSFLESRPDDAEDIHTTLNLVYEYVEDRSSILNKKEFIHT